MIDFTFDEKDKPYFITDIDYDDKIIKVTRADETITEEPFMGHNLGFYRMQMIKGAKNNIEKYMNDLGKDSFFTFVKRYTLIIGGIIGLYFLYNVDIHVVMKILLTILVLLGEVGYFLYNQLYLVVIGSEVMECLATEYYLKNLDKFSYYDKENFTDGFIVPPEDISKYQLTKDMLEQIVGHIDNFKRDGILPEDISLSYKSNIKK